ncbi:MAG TPA: ferritin family protein [Desulfatiglandales bacterium]|nr:ferritin family protein [Desulfatiglandales bacterium]
MDDKTFSDIIHFAIEKEILSYNFYIKASKVVRFPRAKNMFLELAKEEEEHRKLLDNLSIEGAQSRIEGTPYLKVKDYFKEVESKPVMGYADVLRVGIKLEEISVNLYNELKESSKDEDLKKLFSFLAEEEAKHKMKFEEEGFDK